MSRLRNCAGCGVSAHDQPLYRANAYNEPGIFRCRSCFADLPPEELTQLHAALQGHVRDTAAWLETIVARLKDHQLLASQSGAKRVWIELDELDVLLATLTAAQSTARAASYFIAVERARIQDIARAVRGERDWTYTVEQDIDSMGALMDAVDAWDAGPDTGARRQAILESLGQMLQRWHAVRLDQREPARSAHPHLVVAAEREQARIERGLDEEISRLIATSGGPPHD